MTRESPSTLFYVGGVLVSGLLVPANDERLGLGDKGDKTGRSSPFVIAFTRAGWAVVRPRSASNFADPPKLTSPPPSTFSLIPDTECSFQTW